jgi:DNA-binding SARP family transcriptional activator
LSEGEAEFGLLGPLVVRSGGVVLPVSQGKQRVVLAALLLNAGRLVPVDKLAESLWGADPPPSARVAVQNHVMRLRKALRDTGGSRISTLPNGYLISVDAAELDVTRFEDHLSAARAAARGGSWEVAAARARAALALWRGAPLEDVASELLAAQEIPRLAEMRLQAIEMRIDAELHCGRQGEVIAELGQLARAHPLREHLHGLYMIALYREGRQAEALAAYQRARQVLIHELGTEPGPELRQLNQQVLSADPALAAPELTALVTRDPAAGTGPASRGEPGDSGGIAPAGPRPGDAPSALRVRFSLPPDTAAFTGRNEELNLVTAAVTSAAAAGGVVAIHAIDGMPGVGKTSFAVHAAHELAGKFPDRQLFIDLHGYTPGRDPVTAEEALAGLLTAAGVEPRFLPADLEGRAGLWRDKMAGQRAVLVLDNAVDSGQVAPLLPGAAGCLVVVTSRRHLGDLPGAVTPVLLGTLPPPEAADMFTRLVPRAGGDRDGVAEVVGLAGYLPLAISLLARVFARHPLWSLGDLAGETRTRLLTLKAENSSVAIAFEVSYQYLDQERQRFFSLLGVHPGATTDAYAAAALASISVEEAAGHLEALHGEGLVTETGYRRYGMHDLIRRYARDLAAADQVGGRSIQALGRLLDYYQHAAALADERLTRHARPGPGPSVAAGLEIPVLADGVRALAWVRAERASLLACLDLAVRDGQHARVLALTAGLAAVLTRDGPWADAGIRHAAAAAAAQRLGDRLGEANALTDLGTVQRLTGDFPASVQALELALGIYRDLGSQVGEANALSGLGVVRHLTGDYPGADQVLDLALGIYRDLGDRLGEANALRDLGVVRYLTGDYPGADQVAELALGIYRDLADRLGEADALRDLGVIRCVTGDFPGAVHALELALGIYCDLGDRLGEANALHDLGNARCVMGDFPGAAQVLEQALDIYREIGSRVGEANALHCLGGVRRLTGDFPGAAQVLEQALDIYREIGSWVGEASALTEVGGVRRMTGDFPGAAQVLEQALGIYREIGDKQGEVEALNEQGVLHRVGGDLDRAQGCHEQALDLARALGSSREQAGALAGLGRCAKAAGHIARAEVLLQQAHQLFQRIGAAETRDVRAELTALRVSTQADAGRVQ